MPFSQRARKQNWIFSRQKIESSGTSMAFGDQVSNIMRAMMLLTIFIKVSELIANLDLGDGNQIFFYQSIVDLQYCVSFRCTAK